MTHSEISKLTLGLYRVYWNDGGLSVASMGMNETGERWLAPTNWVRPTLMSVVNPDSIARMELITTQKQEVSERSGEKTSAEIFEQFHKDHPCGCLSLDGMDIAGISHTDCNIPLSVMYVESWRHGDPDDKVVLFITNGRGKDILAVTVDGRMHFSPGYTPSQQVEAFRQAINMASQRNVFPLLPETQPECVPHGGGPPLKQVWEVKNGIGGNGGGFIAKDALKEEERLTFNEGCQRFTEFNQEMAFKNRFSTEPLPDECDGMYVVGDDSTVIPHDTA